MTRPLPPAINSQETTLNTRSTTGENDIDPGAPQTRASLRAARKPREKSFLGYLGVVLSAALLIAVSAVAILVIVAPMLVHGQPLTVLTNSMSPQLPPGTLIVIKPTPIDEIRVGDVLTYQVESGKPAVISHRVVERIINLEGQTTFITRGDNNDAVDPSPIEEIQIKGKLWYAIPYLGWINSAINGDARSAITPALAGFLFAYAAYAAVVSIRDKYSRTGQQKAATGRAQNRKRSRTRTH